MVVRDRETGIVMLRLRSRKAGEVTAYTREPAPGWVVDYDDVNAVIEIEVLAPEKHFPKAILDILPPEFIDD